MCIESAECRHFVGAACSGLCREIDKIIAVVGSGKSQEIMSRIANNGTASTETKRATSAAASFKLSNAARHCLFCHKSVNVSPSSWRLTAFQDWGGLHACPSPNSEQSREHNRVELHRRCRWKRRRSKMEEKKPRM
jgi:hypothetical protein